jgi:hypothetical protein
LGVFSGMLLVGLVKELADSRWRNHSRGPTAIESSIMFDAPESKIAQQFSDPHDNDSRE